MENGTRKFMAQNPRHISTLPTSKDTSKYMEKFRLNKTPLFSQKIPAGTIN